MYEYIIYNKGMSSVFTITALSAIRYNSVVDCERSWHLPSYVTCWSSRYVQVIWGLSLIIAVPPLIGFGKFVIDIGLIR